MPSLLLRILALAALLVCTARGVSAEALQTVAAARALPFSAVTDGRPVALNGIVTYLRDIPQDFNFILHDGTGGVMIYPKTRTPLKPGQRVTVTGTTAMSVHGLLIGKADVVPGEMGAMPEPVKLTMADILDGAHDGQFAEFEGVVRAARLESPEIQPRRLALDFGHRGRRLSVWVSDYSTDDKKFAPATTVRVRGVVVRWKNPRGQTQSINVLVNSAGDIASIAPPPEPPVHTIAEVQFWSDANEPATQLTTSGVVTLNRPGELLVLQAEGRAIRVRLLEADTLGTNAATAPRRGDRVDVTGFPTLGEYTVELEDARITQTAADTLPAAEALTTAGAVLKGREIVDRDARRISVPGTLRAIRERDGQLALEMEDGRTTFNAWLPANTALPSAVKPGAALRIDGICTLHLSPAKRRLGRTPDQFSIQLTDPADILVTRTAPWWTPPRLLPALGIAAALALVTALWAGTLSTRNRRLREEILARQRAERELATERHRVAGELHDTLEQTLVAASLQLNAASRTLPVQPESAAAQVSLAHQLVARSRQEVRDAVWDLRLDSSQPGSLAKLLAQACTESSTQAAAEVSFTLENTEPPLPALVIAQAIRLVREAIANALKHAAPQHIRVVERCENNVLHLVVSDDGRGFDPAAAPGPDTGHFGLTTMTERAQRLGGTVRLDTQPGTGTTLHFTLPLCNA